jgi:SAM-dependent methyltransferase
VANVTRGHGYLEPLLARWRAQKANSLIPNRLTLGRILDIGCGSYPYFLSHTSFKEKFAVDQLEPQHSVTDISWHVINLNEDPKLPFEDNFFSAVTLLAVVEHLSPKSMHLLFSEVYRVLAPGGHVILTTPAAWSDGLLRLLAQLNMVSKEEIQEHTFAYTLPLIGWYFGAAGFEMTRLKFGYFEVGLNMWAVGEK